MERKNGLPPVHPGEILKEDVLPSVGLSVTAAAKALGFRVRCFMTFSQDETAVCGYVLEGVAVVWRLTGSMDAVTGGLRSEESRAK